MGLDFEDYGGEYHCWLQVNKPIVFFVLISTVILVVLTFTAIEAAGTLYNVILRIARNFLETRENIKISTHPFYHTNLH